MIRRVPVLSFCVVLIVGLLGMTGCEEKTNGGRGNAKAATQNDATKTSPDQSGLSAASKQEPVKKSDSAVEDHTAKTSKKQADPVAKVDTPLNTGLDVKKEPDVKLSGDFKKGTPVDDNVYEWREKKHPNGQLSERYRVKQKPDGTWVSHGPITRWFDNGDLYMDGEYYEGAMHAMWTTWFPGGQLRGKGEFKYGQRIGRWIHWHENGVKRLDYDHLEGLRHGRFTAWDDDGNVIEEGEYVKDRKEGTWFKVEEDGTVAETYWKNGEEIDPSEAELD